jgi:ferredoxin
VLIGIRCPGVIRGGTGDHPGAVADRCGGCDARTPRLADHLVGELPPPPSSPENARRLAALSAATPAERWSFWRAELGRCVRCHACRQVCPLCHCERCVADKTRPQWIEPSAHGRGNLAWHLTRALHLAGRCAGCDQCERACPVGIPLGLIQRKLAQQVAERFRYRVGDDPTVPAPLGTFDRDDPQEFIL